MLVVLLLTSNLIMLFVECSMINPADEEDCTNKYASELNSSSAHSCHFSRLHNTDVSRNSVETLASARRFISSAEIKSSISETPRKILLSSFITSFKLNMLSQASQVCFLRNFLIFFLCLLIGGNLRFDTTVLCFNCFNQS